MGIKQVKNDFDAFYDEIVDQYTSLASKNLSSGAHTGFIDSGCYILNGLLCGSIFGGIPNNKVTALAGDSGVGKTFIALGIVKSFLEQNKKAIVVYYDTEGAISDQMMKRRGIDTNRVIISEPETLEKFKVHCVKVIDKYREKKIEAPLLIVLDSLGMLSSEKEMEDATKGDIKSDMGRRAQIVKGLFRTITLKLGRARIPFLLTNHTYKTMDQYKPDEVSGGSGLKYAATSIITMTKSKEKEEKEVVGINIRAKNHKSRIAKENAECMMRLRYDTGLHKYFGLLDLAIKQKVVKRAGSYIELPDGKKVYAQAMYDDPAKYFTKDFMKLLDDAAKREFSYGQA